MEEYVKLVLSLVGVGVVSFIGWSFKAHADAQKKQQDLEKQLAALKLYIAENYVKNEVIEELKADVKDMSNLLYEIAGKLGIPIRAN